ncbi:GNAT family N-acetyltransferase [Kushneria aurantia]|uniref:GNAT family N-acetyltransferase n=1 Tax=Kushneria aurantia TaxID=504092 RepID=A0ABV6G5J3_9GAMM|nr:GNAT family N-acetyltransferase [Kushneria aurantia]
MSAHSTSAQKQKSDAGPYRWCRFEDNDLTAALELSTALGWPHRREDWAQMLALGEGIALKDGNGALIGTGFRIDQNDTATLGLIVIHDQWQGKGLGRALTSRLVEAGGAATLMLVATSAGAPLYRRLGFEPCNRVLQYQGVIQAVPPTRPPQGLRPIETADRQAVAALEAGNQVYGLALREAEDGVIIEDRGRLVGLALRRPFGRGEHIGPVLAENAEQARALIAALLARAEGRFVRLDLVDPVEDEWLSPFGLKRVDQVERMYRGTPPTEGRLRRFGLMSQAMG